MVRENPPETSEDRVVNRYLNKCFQRLLNQVDLEYSFELSYGSEKGDIKYKDRINAPQKGLVKKFFLAPETVAEIKRLPFKEKTEKIRLEIRVLNPDYLDKIKTIVVEAMESHRVRIRINKFYHN